MHVALIYPPALLRKYGTKTRYHLVLPHLFQQKRYRDFYQERSKAGDYIILDNGAAEGLGFGRKQLYHVADEIGVQEIVVPDKLGDGNETIARGLAFSRYTRAGYRYMMVAQGKTILEAIQTLDFIMTDTKFMYVTCVGIPRLLNHQDKHARFKLAKYIAKKGYHKAMEFHFLGATRDLDEVGYLEETGIGRGIDTSAPIYMGLKGWDIKIHDWASRPPDYFDLDKDNKMVDKNIKSYLRWANYKLTLPLPERAEYDRAQTS